jgi:hypothetical protein
MVPGANRSAARALDEERPLRRRLPDDRVGGGAGGPLATVASSLGGTAGPAGAVSDPSGAVAASEDMVSSSSPVSAKGAWQTGHDSQGVGCS